MTTTAARLQSEYRKCFGAFDRSIWMGHARRAISQWLARVVSLSVQTFLFETRKLDLQETLQNLAWALCANIERAQFRARK
jgi:hypothetical protein